MQKSEFSKMHHYVGFWQIGSQMHTHTKHTHKHTQAHTHTNTHTYTQAHTHTSTHTHTHTSTHTHTHTCKYTDIHTNIQVYTHCTNARTHTERKAIPDHVYKYKHDTLHIVWHETKIKICQLFTQMIQR